MKRITNITHLLLFVLILTIGCERADELSQSDIVSADWRVSKVIIDGSLDESKDYSNYTFSFTRDLSYSFTEAPAENVEISGTWILSDDSKHLHLTGDSGTEIAIPINELTEEKAELVFTIPATFKSPEKTAIFFLVRQ